MYSRVDFVPSQFCSALVSKQLDFQCLATTQSWFQHSLVLVQSLFANVVFSMDFHPIKMSPMQGLFFPYQLKLCIATLYMLVLSYNQSPLNLPPLPPAACSNLPNVQQRDSSQKYAPSSCPWHDNTIHSALSTLSCKYALYTGATQNNAEHYFDICN